jgi:glycogen(starch) synthase
VAVRRVLMTADTVGGVWTYALELTRALAAHGTSVDLATMGAPLTAAQRAEAAAARNLRVFESPFLLEWMEEPWEDVARAGEWLLSLEDHLRPDLVHLNGYVHGALPWRAPALVVGHSCVLSWWRGVHGCAAPSAWDRYATEVRAGLAGADAVVAPTVAMLASLQEHYGPLPPAAVIPNGRRHDAFVPAVKEYFVFSAGRLWDEAKNLAALDVAAEGLRWPVLAAGEDTRPQGGTVRAGSLRMLGRLGGEEIGQWLGRAAIYALPARYEPFGLSALEAALAGCALVLGDIPSLREVWGETACFVSPGDPKALRRVLDELIDDEARRRELADRARRRALELTPERMARLYGLVYDTLVASGREVAACAS